MTVYCEVEHCRFNHLGKCSKRVIRIEDVGDGGVCLDYTEYIGKNHGDNLVIVEPATT